MKVAGRQSHHDLLGKDVEKAWVSVLSAVTEAERACDLSRATDGDEATERAEHQAKYDAWIEAGSPTGQSPGQYRVDWGSIRTHRLAVARKAVQGSIGVARQYAETVQAADPQVAAERAVRAFEKAHKKAAEARAVLDDSLRRAIEASRAVRDLDKATGLTPEGLWLSPHVGRGGKGTEGKALAALSDLERWDEAAASDPVVNGTFVLDDTRTLPMVTRLYIAEHGTNHQASVLAALEVVEKQQVSDLTGDAYARYLTVPWIDEVRRAMASGDLGRLLR